MFLIFCVVLTCFCFVLFVWFTGTGFILFVFFYFMSIGGCKCSLGALFVYSSVTACVLLFVWDTFEQNIYDMNVYQMAPPQKLRQQTSNCSLLLIYGPRKDERLSWPGWLTYSGRFTHISGHPSELQVERRTVKARRPKTDVLPLDHATNMRTDGSLATTVRIRSYRMFRLTPGNLVCVAFHL